MSALPSPSRSSGRVPLNADCSEGSTGHVLIDRRGEANYLKERVIEDLRVPCFFLNSIKRDFRLGFFGILPLYYWLGGVRSRSRLPCHSGRISREVDWPMAVCSRGLTHG